MTTDSHTLPLDTVMADRETGEWTDTPESTGARVVAADWHAKQDTADEHYDTYEQFGVTRALLVRWTD